MAQTNSSALAEYVGEPVSQLTWREWSYLKGSKFEHDFERGMRLLKG